MTEQSYMIETQSRVDGTWRCIWIVFCSQIDKLREYVAGRDYPARVRETTQLEAKVHDRRITTRFDGNAFVPLDD